MLLLSTQKDELTHAKNLVFYTQFFNKAFWERWSLQLDWFCQFLNSTSSSTVGLAIIICYIFCQIQGYNGHLDAYVYLSSPSPQSITTTTYQDLKSFQVRYTVTILIFSRSTVVSFIQHVLLCLQCFKQLICHDLHSVSNSFFDIADYHHISIKSRSLYDRCVSYIIAALTQIHEKKKKKKIRCCFSKKTNPKP